MPVSPSATWSGDPYDWNELDVLTEDRMVDISSRLMWLKVRVFNTASVATTTTTSTSFVALTGGSVSLTSTGGNVLIVVQGAISNSGAGNSDILDIALDGTRYGHATSGLRYRSSPVATYYDMVEMQYMTTTAPSAGAHTYAIYWRTTAGTLTWGADIGRISAFEFR